MRCLDKSNMVPEKRHQLGAKRMTTQEFNLAFPIVGYWIHNAGIVIYRECAIDSLKDLRTGKRQKVTSLSPRSLHRLALLAMSTPIQWKSILTLTYGPNYTLEGQKVKHHLNYMLTKLRRTWGEFQYLWFLEFQQRGAPHFHILTTMPSPSKAQRAKFAAMWADIVEPQNWLYERIIWAEGQATYHGQLLSNDATRAVHRHTKNFATIRKQGGARRYMVKYALKLEQKIVPRAYRNVGRFWGKVSR